MQKFKTSLLIALMTVAALGQTATELDSPPVMRVAAKLKCSCGCMQNMACMMAPGCPLCKMNRAKILSMQQSGMNDKQILDRYVAENGADVLEVLPGVGGFAGPYVALGLGFLVVLWTIRRYMRKAPALAGAAAGAAPGIDAAVDQATLARIQKDTANLD